MTRYPCVLIGRCLVPPLLIFTLMLTVGCGDDSASHDGHDHAGHDHRSHDAEDSATVILAAHQHENADATCFMCDATKREEGRLWCREHLRYEDRCWLCQPQLEDKDRPYCTEHFLYEDECHLCRPELKDAAASGGHDQSDHEGHDHGSHDGHDHGIHEGHDHGDHDGHDHSTHGSEASDGHDDQAGHNHGDGSSHSMRDGRLWCGEHGVYEDECGICQPQLAASLEPGENMKIRFPSAESAGKAGVEVGRAEVAEVAPSIEALCEVQYDLNAMARVTPLAEGVIRKVHHDVGQRVEAGDVLVELHSAQVATAKSDYLAALVQRDIGQQAMTRQERLRDQNIAAEKDLLEAQALHRSASLQANNLRQRLVNLGFTDDEIAAIEESQDTSAKLSVRAPFGGTIIERDAVIGESVPTGKPLFTVADMSKRWLMLSIPARYLTQIKTGQPVIARFDDLPGVEVRGEITWIDTAIDPRSRLVKARAVVTDDADRIKTGLFGRAVVVTGESQPATVVPRDSVQQHEGNSFVFVRDEADLYSLRRVSLGQSNGQTVEVLAGLTAADPVVTAGSFVVMSEFLKSRLGAGCADH
ncbi:MAG: efflux RND transporter periplasmic adaptor subunit [Planctomycetota bacterium]